MRKITLLLALLALLGMQVVLAQSTIKGKVTSASDGSPVPGATIIAKEVAGVGSISDFDGNYSIEVPANVATLIFSFVGMQTVVVPINGRTEINIQLSQEDVSLDDIVVTALGVTREKKALGYSVQDVKGDAINRARENNLVNSLSGKIAGVQITGGSGNTGGSARILIRGVNSVAGNNQPLFVVDGIAFDNNNYNNANTARGAGGVDYGNMAQDINSDDIESISVLKGPNAAALYGSRAANGVILITTKKGSSKGALQPGKALGVSVNSGVSFEQVSILPKYQELYGGGSIYEGDDADRGFQKIQIDGKDYLIHDYGTDESWGPKYDPSISVLQWNCFDKWDTENYLKPRPWVGTSNGPESFFRTGTAFTNNVSVTGGTGIANFRISYTNLTSKGYMPNSDFDRNTFNFSGSANLSKKLNVFATGNYVKTNAVGRPTTGYDDNNIMQKFNQWGQRQLDMTALKAYKNPDGTQRTWNRIAYDDPTPLYSDNPYWTRHENAGNDQRDRYFGNFGLTYDIFNWLKVTGKVNLDNYSFRIEEKVAIGSQATPSYSETIRDMSELNSEFLFSANKKLSDMVNLNVNFGGNQRNRTYQRNGNTTSGGLIVKELYTLGNSVSPYLADDYKERKKVNSLYGSASLGVADMAYLDVTLRNDWSSTLPESNNSYLYPSFTASYLISELKFLKDLKFFSFGKIRAGWAQAGNDTDPYNIVNTYANALDIDNNSSPYHFGSNPLFTIPTTLNNKDLKAETTTSLEAGAELKFFDNRLGIDFSYYNKSTKDQILAVEVSSASGYRFNVINAGEIVNKGIELLFTATPIKMNDFQWDITFNWSKNQNEVKALTTGVDAYLLANAPFIVSVNAKVGEPYGSIMGPNYVFDANGNKIVGTNGRFVNSPITSLGSVLPDWNGGILNTFKYKGFDLSCLIDMQKGGRLFSTTHMWGWYSGILEETAATNANGKNVRDPVDEGGGVLIDGVYGSLNADGTVQWLTKDGAKSDVPVKNETWIGGDRFAWDHYSRAAGGQNTFDADYIKLREITVGYTIPKKFTGPIQGLRISAFGRNLAMWGTKVPHIDPESATSSGNVQGLEGAQLPSLRTFGFNIGFTF